MTAQLRRVTSTPAKTDKHDNVVRDRFVELMRERRKDRILDAFGVEGYVVTVQRIADRPEILYSLRVYTLDGKFKSIVWVNGEEIICDGYIV